MGNKTKFEHTPGKWRVEEKSFAIGDTGDYDGAVDVLAEGQEYPIARIDYNVHFRPDEENLANANRIAMAVNAHDELIEGIKNIREFAEKSNTLSRSDRSFIIGETSELLKQAIADTQPQG